MSNPVNKHMHSHIGHASARNSGRTPNGRQVAAGVSGLNVSPSASSGCGDISCVRAQQHEVSAKFPELDGGLFVASNDKFSFEEVQSLIGQSATKHMRVKLNLTEQKKADLEDAAGLFVKKPTKTRIFMMIWYVLAVIGLVVASPFLYKPVFIFAVVLAAIFLSFALYRACKGRSPYTCVYVTDIPAFDSDYYEILQSSSSLTDRFMQDLNESWEFIWDCLTHTKKIPATTSRAPVLGLGKYMTVSKERSIIAMRDGGYLVKDNTHHSTAKEIVRSFKHFFNCYFGK